MIIDRNFFLQKDVVYLAQILLGKYLFSYIDGIFCGGIISETEAYNGEVDKASHAFGGRYTARTEMMYKKGGIAYVYLCYGVHSLFNIVTNQIGIPHAILIRSIIPTHGLNEMEKRLNKKISNKYLLDGPGKVSKALGIHYHMTGIDLVKRTKKNMTSIWLEDRGVTINKEEYEITTRIGVDYAGEDALLPYRFIITKKIV